MKNMIDLLLHHPGIEAFGLAILHSLWQGALIAAALFIMLQFVKSNVNLRYLLACGALLCLLLAFCYTFYLSYTPPVQASNNITSGFTASNHFLSQVFISQSAEMEEEKAFSFTDAQAVVVGWIERNSHYIFVLWLMGFLVFSSRLCLGLYYAQKLKRNGQQPESVWIHTLDQLRHTLGIKRAVRLLTSTQIHTPFTLGWIRPAILLPVSMLTQLPSEHIESILLHELAHIRRQDYLVNLLQSVVESLLFFNPAYWYMARIMERERENACDDVAVGIIRQPIRYARALTQVAELSRTDFLLSKTTIAVSKGSLTERIQRIVLSSAGQTMQRSEKAKWYLMSVVALAVLGTILITEEVRGHQSEKDVETTMHTDPDVDIEEEVVVDLEVGIEEEVDVEIEEEVDVNLDIDIEESIDLDLDVDAMGALLDSASLYHFLHSQWEYIKKQKTAKGEEVSDNVLLSDKTLYIVDGVARDPKTIKPPFEYTMKVPLTVMWAAMQLFGYPKIVDSYAAFRKKYPGDYDNVVILTSKVLKPEINPDEPFILTGRVFNQSAGTPISDAKVEIQRVTDINGKTDTTRKETMNSSDTGTVKGKASAIVLEVDENREDLPLYLVDGVEVSPPGVKKLDPQSLGEIEVIQKENAVKYYGEKGKNGVVLVRTKKSLQEVRVQLSSLSNSGEPLYVVDGKRYNDQEFSLATLSPEDIASIDVLKGEEAKKKYGEKGKNGVILITTKVRVEAEKGPLSPREDSRPPLFVIDGRRYTYQELSNLNAGGGKSITVKSGNSEFKINLDPDDIISMNVVNVGLGITSSGKKPVDVVFIKTKRGNNQYAKETGKPTSTLNFSDDKVLHILDGEKANPQTIKSSNVGSIDVIRAEDATFYQQKIFEEYRQKYPGDYDYMVVATSRNKNSDKENIHHKEAYDQKYFHTLQSWFEYHNAPSQKALTERVGIKNLPIPNSYDGRRATQMSIVDGSIQNWWVVKPYEVATVEMYQSSDTFSYFYNVEKGYGMVSTGGNDKLEYLRKIYPGEYDELLIITTQKGNTSSAHLIEETAASEQLKVFPNPSENIFTIQLTLAEDAPVQVNVIDAAGRLVTSLTDRSMGKGLLELRWDASGQKPGLYRIRVIQNGETTYRNVLVK